MAANVTFVAPLLMVTNIQRSLAFYVEGLGFSVKNEWKPDGRLRWVWLSLGSAHLMLQEPDPPEQLSASAPLGHGASFYFQTSDALAIYRDVATRNIHPIQEPQVGNGNWEVFFTDPDGYKINFASPTDVPEETRLSKITS